MRGMHGPDLVEEVFVPLPEDGKNPLQSLRCLKKDHAGADAA